MRIATGRRAPTGAIAMRSRTRPASASTRNRMSAPAGNTTIYGADSLQAAAPREARSACEAGGPGDLCERALALQFHFVAVAVQWAIHQEEE